MKIVLTREELADVIRKHYPAPPHQVVSDVEIQKHSADFCTIAFEPTPESVSATEAAIRG